MADTVRARLVARWAWAIRPRRWWMMIRCLAPLGPGATVVIVNWDSLAYLRTTIAAVRRFSAGGTRIIVVDNGSHDGSLAWLRTEKVETVALGANFGHGAGLDLGWLRARTRIVIALDVDAFPISDTWLPRLAAALDSGATVAGAHGGAILDRLAPELPEGWVTGTSFIRAVWRCGSAASSTSDTRSARIGHGGSTLPS